MGDSDNHSTPGKKGMSMRRTGGQRSHMIPRSNGVFRTGQPLTKVAEHSLIFPDVQRAQKALSCLCREREKHQSAMEARSGVESVCLAEMASKTIIQIERVP